MSETTARTALRALIIADVTVSGLIGARFFSGDPPDTVTKPYVSSYSIDARGNLSHDRADNLTDLLLQLNCVGSSIGSALAVADAIKEAVQGYQGVSGGVNFRRIEVTGEGEDREPDSNLYLKRIDLDIAYV